MFGMVQDYIKYVRPPTEDCDHVFITKKQLNKKDGKNLYEQDDEGDEDESDDNEEHDEDDEEDEEEVNEDDGRYHRLTSSALNKILKREFKAVGHTKRITYSLLRKSTVSKVVSNCF